MTEKIQQKKERLTQEIELAKTALKQGGLARIISSHSPEEQNGQNSYESQSSISSTIIDMVLEMLTSKVNILQILSKLLRW